MISKEQIELNVCTAYIEYVRGCLPEESEVSKQYLHILKIRQWQLRRRKMKRVQSLEDLATLRYGHHAAERFYFDFLNESSTNQMELEIIDILQGIAVQFHSKIGEIEAQHPKLRQQFASEREYYRRAWNFYVTEANELKGYEEHEV